MRNPPYTRLVAIPTSTLIEVKLKWFSKLTSARLLPELAGNFLSEALKALHFPAQFTTWIMQCVTDPSFSILLNGKPRGFFKSNRGLRQGCPLSPYLLCIVFLSAGLTPTPFSKGRGSVSHLLFADYLLIFSYASMEAATHIQNVLQKFEVDSGLMVNSKKSLVIFSNCEASTRESICASLKFNQQSLSIMYLGLPLLSARLKANDCQDIISKLRKRLSEEQSSSSQLFPPPYLLGS